MERIYRCTSAEESINLSAAECALMISPEDKDITTGYGAYLYPQSCECPFDNSYPVPEKAKPGSFVLCCDDSSGRTVKLLPASDIPDRVLFTTGLCNSNCIMCPYTEYFRQRAENVSIETLQRYVALMDPSSDYLCITGGEPTLLKEDFLVLLDTVRKHFESAIVHVLTNGRTFCYKDFVNEYRKVRPYNTLLGIPLHASNAELHDYITQSPGSFAETTSALDNLQFYGEHIELRVVTSDLNKTDLPDLASFIASRYPNVRHVCFMGLEMMGNAMAHRESIWCTFEEIMPYVDSSVNILVNAGIPVQLYNYPLCSINQKYYSLYRRSITPSKIEFLPECNNCKKRELCGGFFRQTIIMPGIKVHPF